MLALLLSGIGGLIGGYVIYFVRGKNFNPVIGIVGVSCVPSTAKVAQKEVHKANKMSFVFRVCVRGKYLRSNYDCNFNGYLYYCVTVDNKKRFVFNLHPDAQLAGALTSIRLPILISHGQWKSE